MHGVLPRAAALLDVQQISDISGIESDDTFVRPIYAGNAMATVRSGDALKLITVRTTSFEAAEQTGSAPIEAITGGVDSQLSTFAGEELTRSERPELTTADIIVSGGRGMQSSENFAMLEAFTLLREISPRILPEPVNLLSDLHRLDDALPLPGR